MLHRAFSTPTSDSPEALLRGLLYVIDRTKLPPVEIIAHIKETVKEAVTLLTTPDDFQKRVSFVLLAIEQSTQVEVKQVNGRAITKVKIVDLNLYNWALDQVHKMAEDS